MISKRLRLERLERRDLLASDWTNPLNPLDVNVSGEVTPLDVLLIVNDINRSGSRILPASIEVVPTLVDVNADGAVSPIDVFQVVNALNRYSGMPEVTFEKILQGSGESAFVGRTTPNARVIVEQLDVAAPQRWEFTSDANGEFQGFEVADHYMTMRAKVTDPLGRVVTQEFAFAPGQDLATRAAVATDNTGPRVGETAPDFQLLNQMGESVSLTNELQAGTVVLYFYPKDNTPKCSIEAQDFRNRSAEIEALGAHVVGISVDPVDSHLEFFDQYALNFDILADTEYLVSKAYGVLSSFKDKPIALRTTFVISHDGVIREVFHDVDVKIHGQRVVDALATLTT